ncbi:MAG: hypothetical protein FWC34_03440 [Bacteroidetes bacterium]|nr:hypothetical protein [Bacteroidota bacterium]
MENFKKPKLRLCLIFLFALYLNLFVLNFTFGQNQEKYSELIKEAWTFYEAKEYLKSGHKYSEAFIALGGKGFVNDRYNAACSWALANEIDSAFVQLFKIVPNGYYTNLAHLMRDSDLDNLRKYPQWNEMIDEVRASIQEKAAKELLKAKRILEDDAGKLWGKSIWDDHVLVFSFDNMVYSLTHFEGSSLNENSLYSALLPENKLFYTNSIQEYDGKRYAVVRDDYLSDNSATIIHELFHVLQEKHRMLNGNAISYLDNYDAREWLRLEYQALRNCLNSIDQNKDLKTISDYLQDAMVYRKIRQTQYPSFLEMETEIETLEGLANYTGYVLSTYPNKYELAIEEINERERPDTYVRAFSYATGFAYGMIFDYLEIDWKLGLDTVYNFLDIYEEKYLKELLNVTRQRESEANDRNNFAIIHKEETERKERNERKIKLLRQQLIELPTLSVILPMTYFAQMYDMNGTVVIDNLNTAYTTLFHGTDASQGENFGSFKFSSQRQDHEITGVLISRRENIATLIFPLPFRIEGNKIIGDTYEITLNDNWKIERKNEKGDFEIVEKKE